MFKTPIKKKFNLTVFSGFLLSTILTAQIIDTHYLDGLKFRMVGPHRGGRVTAVAGVGSEILTYYMGATGGGVWKTTDAGVSWQNISDGYFNTSSIGAIAVSESDPNILYTGTGSGCPRGNISIGDGMYKSTDAGKTWKHIGLEKSGSIARLALHPHEPDVVFAAVLGNPFGPNKERGVYRSKDGGSSWQQVLAVNDKTGACDIVMDPSNPLIIYAAMWTAERKPWTMIDGSEQGGVWKTIDGGDTWSKLTGGLPSGILGRIGVAVSPANPDRVWVLIETKAEETGGLYRSENAGKTFAKINRDHELRQRAWYYTHIFADPKDEHTIYVLNVNFMKSIDGGKSFSNIRVPHGDNHGLWINPSQPEIMIQSNDGGACITFNGGKTWSSQYNQPTAEFYRLTIDNQFPYRLYAAQQDNTTISVPSRPLAGLTNYEHWYEVGGGESGHIAVDPRNPNIIYAGTYIGQITRKDRASGHERDVVAYPQMHDGTAPRDIKYRFQWNAPIRLSPHNPDILYHCSQYVHRSTDGGRRWEVISPDLTTDNDQYHNIPGGPVQHDHTGVELFTTVFAFEESPHKAGELWAGSDDGLLHLSHDAGKNWQNISPKGIPKDATINHIGLSPHQAGEAWISVHNYRQNDFKPYVFYTADYGKTWQLLTTGIKSNHFVRVVQEDPNRKGLLYAGTEFGLYFSINAGHNWYSLQLNLPITPIADLAVKDKDLVVATQGRSFWILDDLCPLHQWDLNTIKNSSFLLEPRPAYRTQLRNQRGQVAPDPAPNGAILYFFLSQNPDSNRIVKLFIHDAEGKIRRSFSTKPNEAMKEELLNARKGLNRIEWDLRYEEPEVQKGAVFSLADLSGVHAAPGLHLVTLMEGEQKWQQKLTIAKDPRWTQTDADLLAQYDLTMRVKELLNQAHSAIGKIRKYRQQLKAIPGKITTATEKSAIQSQVEKITHELTELEHKLIQTKSETGQDPINYPSMIDDQIAYLYSIVNGQDDRPTEGSYQRYEDLKKSIQVLLQELDQITVSDITALNKRLRDMTIDWITE